MHFSEIIFIAIGLAMDAFAVSIAAATTGYINGPRPVFRLSFHFGFFQFFMPIIGWFIGIRLAEMIQSIDHWIAFFLLAFVGSRMVFSSLAQDSEPQLKHDPSRGKTLVMLSIATSIDALVIGFSLGMLQVRIWFPSVVIGIVTAAFSLLGILFGYHLGKRFGKRIETVGGIIIILIGLRILLSHLFG